MPVIKYSDILGGMYPDIPYHTQKPNEWTNLKNCRTWVRSVDKVGGWVNEFTYPLGISQPNMVQFWEAMNSGGTLNGYFVYAKAGNIRRIGAAGDTDIRQNGTDYTNVLTPATPTIPDLAEWNFTAMNGGYDMVVSNPYITPQYMDGDANTLADLPGWVNNSVVLNVVATTAQVVRAFSNQLIAGNIAYLLNDGTIVRRPSTILISDDAPPGGIPQSWSATSSNAADSFELTSTDPIYDIVVFRNNALALCQNSMFLIGKSVSQSPTSVTQLSSVRGIIGKGAVQVVDGFCYVVTTDDIIKLDGSSTNFKSIANDIIKTTFFESELNINAGSSVFMRYHRYFNELMIAYPSKSSGGTVCDKALIYSLDDGAWSWTDLPGVYDATTAPVVGNGNSDPYRAWPINTYNYNVQRLHFASGNQLQAMDIGTDRNGPYEVLMERFFDLDAYEDKSAKTVQNVGSQVTKQLNAIYPTFVGDGSLQVQLKFFQTPVPNGSIDWTTPDQVLSYDVNAVAPDYKIDAYGRFRFMAMRIVSNTNLQLQLCDFSMDISPSGKFG